MLLTTITLQNFRSFKKADFSFSPTTTIIVGPNAAGKTNLLESVYVLATGKSFRAGLEEEMVNSEVELARVSGEVVQDGEKLNLEVMLVKTQKEGVQLGKKKLLVNKVSRRLIDYQGNLRVVLFGPWDVNLITNSPSSRRKFLDIVLSQADREYRRSLLSYEKGLRARNRLLERIREEGGSRSQLVFWDKLLIKNGDYLSKKREEFIMFVNNTSALGGEQFLLEYDKSAISEMRLLQYAQEEVAAATTLVGPHRDDVIFKSIKGNENRDLAVYGSRGEQRMCVLWMKLAELAFIDEKTGVRPLLLLDDIFSELDHKHRDIVMEVVAKQQTIITTADPHVFKLHRGEVKIELPYGIV